jgi:hypothetical protein
VLGRPSEVYDEAVLVVDRIDPVERGASKHTSGAGRLGPRLALRGENPQAASRTRHTFSVPVFHLPRPKKIS